MMANTNEILYASIAEVGRLYRSGELSPVEVTRLTLERIEALDSTFNAFITVTAEIALDAAHQAEQELRSGIDRGLMHGIPVALKDLIDTAGIRTTAGARILAGYIPDRDAPLVRHLQEAGAVLIGKTNMFEFAYGHVHPDYGQTWNPWNPARISGGSSSGSAAAVAAGFCYAAVGTDTGGSIRVPAAYTGITGLKPTYGLVSADGVFPLSWSLDHVGPMARSSLDAALLLQALQGQRPTGLQPASLQGLKLGILTDHVESPEVEAAVRAAFDTGCELLAAAGATLYPVTIPDLDLSSGAIFTIVVSEASAIHARWIIERPEDYAAPTRQQIELGFAIPAVVQIRAQQYRRHLASQFLAALETVDAILSPTIPWVAPIEDPFEVGDKGAVEVRRTAPHNLTGLPALSIPCGFDPEGLPVGLQIITRPGADELALGIGMAFEALYPEFQASYPSIGNESKK